MFCSVRFSYLCRRQNLISIFSPIITLVFASVSLSTLSGCGIITDQEELPPLREVSAAELFISKRTTQDVEFEQYKLTGAGMFRECGKIRRGRYYPEQQDLITLDAQGREDISYAINQLIRSEAQSNARFAEPGVNGAVWDPGQLTLQMTLDGEQRTIKTSVDSIATPRTVPEARLKDAVIRIRHLGGGITCPHKTFFGLSSRIQRPTP